MLSRTRRFQWPGLPTGIAGSAKPWFGPVVPSWGSAFPGGWIGARRTHGSRWERQALAWPFPCRAGARRSQGAGWVLTCPWGAGSAKPQLGLVRAELGRGVPGGRVGSGVSMGMAGSAKPQLGLVRAELGLGVPRGGLGPASPWGWLGAPSPSLALSVPSWGSAFPGGGLGPDVSMGRWERQALVWPCRAELGLGVPRGVDWGPAYPWESLGAPSPSLAFSVPSWGSAFPGGGLGPAFPHADSGPIHGISGHKAAKRSGTPPPDHGAHGLAATSKNGPRWGIITAGL
ncbi:hypothetical protein SAMN05421721_10912 [Ectothiorhodospira mobilis]|uniref:Uncharacterized protein n=1 Tax=Ectothiorhodospira mobilis TaxID=195064 RepID=A0A1I4RQL5_ECTMO|nr:hypothetical protein SAMN05421721_10912 [Ectothiorhodospira mobilis]